MTWAVVRIIAFKELRERLRDRKTLVLMVVLPMVLYPVLFLGLGQLTALQQGKIAHKTMQVGLKGGPIPPTLQAALDLMPHTTLSAVSDAYTSIRTGQVQAVLLVADHTHGAVVQGDQGEVSILFDGGSDWSRQAKERVHEALQNYVDDVRAQRLDGAGLRPEFIDPLSVRIKNVAPPERQGGWLLGQILPMLVSLLLIGGAFYPAIDLTAGEKERGTLQTLLSAPIASLDIVAGKYLAVVVIAMLAGMMNLLSIMLVALHMPLPDALAGELSFSLGLDVIALILLCLLLLAMMFSAVMMAVAVTAKSFKEAQNYLTPLYLLAIFPLLVAGLPGVELSFSTVAIPILNIALLMKALLLGPVSTALLAAVLVSTLAWVALSLVFATRVFSQEGVLLGDAGWGAMFARRPRGAKRALIPTIGESVTLLGLVLLLLFYGSLAIRDTSVLTMIHVTQWGFLLAPTFVLVLLLRLDLRQTFALRRPPFWSLACAVLLGLGLWYAAGLMMEALMREGMPLPTPAWEALTRRFEELGQDPSQALLLFAGVAIAPAICEEFLFRGVLLQSLAARLSRRWSVLISALLFAIYHLNPHQLPTTLLVGLFLGYLVLVAGSIWPAVLLHALHNGLALAVQLYAPEHVTSESLQWLLLGPLLGLGLLLWHARRSRQERL